MLLCFGISILFGHAKIEDVNDVDGFGVGSADEEIVGLDIAIDEVLFVNGLYSRQLQMDKWVNMARRSSQRTICFATMTTVLMENRRLQ